MFFKILASLTLIVPLARGLNEIWDNSESGIPEKIAESLTIIVPLITGFHQTWKKK